MKKSLLTLGAVAAFASGAFAQGYVFVNTPTAAGFNTTSSSSAAPSGWYTGNVTLAVYSIAASGANYTLSQTINTDAGTIANEQTAIGLIESDFAAQNIGTSQGSLTASVLFNVNGGDFSTAAAGGGQGTGDYYVGTSISGSVLYAIIATSQNGLLSGGLVLNAPGSAGYTVGSAPPGTPNLMANDWGNGQNLFLAPVPEPTTLALAGLGGLSLLALRRRKA